MAKPKLTPKLRQCPPPKKTTIGPRVHIVGAEEDLRVIVLSPQIHGFTTHWTGSRTIGCTDPQSHCIGCQNDMNSRYAGFLHVIPTGRGTSFFVWLTEDSVAPLVPLSQTKSLARSIIRIYRTRKHIQAPLAVLVVDRLRDDQIIIPAIDPTETLMKIWSPDLKRRRKIT